MMKRAPSFRLQDETGTYRTLEDFLAKGPLVVAFYPGDFTPVCTQQLCSYRDRYESLKIQVVGISNDSVESHAKFKAEKKFPFSLLSDPKHEAAKAFGAKSKWLFGMPTRANFIISSTGEILFSHIDAVPVTHHKVQNLADVVDQLRKEGKLT